MHTGTESGSAALPGSAGTRATTALRLVGRDALSLVHRLSTQVVEDLEPGEARPTLFCDFRGRLLHRAVAARTTDGALWLLREDAPAAELAAYIDRHVFRDDVSIEDRSAARTVLPSPGGFGLAAGTVRETGGAPARVQLDWDYGLELADAPAAPPEDAERARVLAGRPRHGHEIRDEFHPYEVRLAHEVHLSKGCYTGQETLLRLLTYRGTRRHLARVRGTGAAPETPCDALIDGERAGRLTSAVAADHGWIGLAVLRDVVFEPPASVITAGGGWVEILARLPDTEPLGLP
jgi:hypothetical protein